VNGAGEANADRDTVEVGVLARPGGLRDATPEIC